MRTCDTRAEAGGPTAFRERRDDVRAGSVILYGLDRAASPRNLPPDPRGRPLSWKSPAIVRASRVVTISIAPADRAFARLTFAGRRSLNTLAGWPVAVRFRAFAADEPAFSYRCPPPGGAAQAR